MIGDFYDAIYWMREVVNAVSSVPLGTEVLLVNSGCPLGLFSRLPLVAEDDIEPGVLVRIGVALEAEAEDE